MGYGGFSAKLNSETAQKQHNIMCNYSIKSKHTNKIHYNMINKHVCLFIYLWALILGLPHLKTFSDVSFQDICQIFCP